MERIILAAIDFAFVLSMLLLLPFYAKAQHPEFKTVSNEIKNSFDERNKRIKQELENLRGNEWAGSYWAQIGLMDGALFVWSPSNGFTVRSGNDFHRGVEKVNYGSASFNGNLLTLAPEFLGKSKHTYPISSSLIPVRWDKQHWLIPSDELMLFIYAVNSGDDDEIASFFVKYEDSKKSPNGLPDVPKEYRTYLKRKPIKAKVTSLNADDKAYLGYTLTLNVGKDAGVITGMHFYLIKVKDVFVKVQVTAVDKNKSTARIVSIGLSGEDNKEINPKTGWEFSSKFNSDY